MGQGYCYQCKKCKNEYDLQLGSGMGTPFLVEEILEEINSGKWGERYKRLSEEGIIYPNVETELYVCNTCGNWKAEMNMNLYAPKDRVHGSSYESNTVKYVGWWELKKDFHVVLRKVHVCECGKKMHKVNHESIGPLSCPSCGEINESMYVYKWD